MSGAQWTIYSPDGTQRSVSGQPPGEWARGVLEHDGPDIFVAVGPYSMRASALTQALDADRMLSSIARVSGCRTAARGGVVLLEQQR